MKPHGMVALVALALSGQLAAAVAWAEDSVFTSFAESAAAGAPESWTAANAPPAAGDWPLLDGYGCDADCCCAAPFWFAGVEATFLSLSADTGGQVTLTVNDSDTVGTDLQLLGGNGLEDTFAVAPRLWAGRQISEKWGVVGRFWYLSQSDFGPGQPPEGVVNLTNFLTTTDAARAELYTIDVEAVRSFRPGAWKIDGSGGVRHAAIDMWSSLDAFGVFTTGNYMQLSYATASGFNGTGLTGGLTARRQIGNSPMSLFLSGRGSVLWGHSDSLGRAAGTLAVSPNAPLLGAATVTRNNAEATLTIGEFQAGAQWDFPLQRLPVHAFFRAAVEYQHWTIDGPPTGGAGFGGTLADITVNSFASAGLGDAHLVGASLATGFTW